jgi:hypothetical protein
MNNPEVEQLALQNLYTNRIVPIYSLTAHITSDSGSCTSRNHWSPRTRTHCPAPPSKRDDPLLHLRKSFSKLVE